MNSNQQTEENEKDIKDLKAFLIFYMKEILKVSDESIEDLSKRLEKTKGKNSLRGLKQAINDCLESARDFKDDEVKEIDKRLEKNGITNLTTLRRKYWNYYKRIQKRGIIKNDQEYYLIISVLNDTSTNSESDEQNELNKLVRTYEDSKKEI